MICFVLFGEGFTADLCHWPSHSYLGDSEGVGPAGARFGLFEEGRQPGQPQEPVGAHHHGARRTLADDRTVPQEVQEVGGQQAEQVQFAAETGQIVSTQPGRISHQ